MKEKVKVTKDIPLVGNTINARNVSIKKVPTVAECWEEYRDAVLKPEDDYRLILNSKRAFYNGCSHMFLNIAEIASTTLEPKDKNRILAQWKNEIMAYKEIVGTKKEIETL